MRKIDKPNQPSHKSIKESLEKLYAPDCDFQTHNCFIKKTEDRNGQTKPVPKCAYCEVAKSAGNILVKEHYRPQNDNQYPWLSNEWTNMVLSCSDCNAGEGGKHTKFPIQGRLATSNDGLHIVTLNQIEKPYLLNPEVDEPETHLRFLVTPLDDDRLFMLRGKTKRGKKSIYKILNLNRPDLITDRARVYGQLIEPIISCCKHFLDDYELALDGKILNFDKNEFLKNKFADEIANFKRLCQCKRESHTLFRRFLLTNFEAVYEYRIVNSEPELGKLGWRFILEAFRRFQ